MQKTLAPAVIRYLDALEISLKSKSGVVPEDAISDARSHLERACLDTEDTIQDDEELYAHLVDQFGEPEVVAAQYRDEASPITMPGKGYAPGWRIYCTKCGRSAPASEAGVIRIGARSYHKYVLGWCRQCSWFRWLRLQRDLDDTNITRKIGTDLTPEKYRASIHIPVWSIFVLATVFSLISTWVINHFWH